MEFHRYRFKHSGATGVLAVKGRSLCVAVSIRPHQELEIEMQRFRKKLGTRWCICIETETQTWSLHTHASR